MVSFKAIQAANNTIASKSLTALFAGSTSGIGLGAIEALLKNTQSPKVFIIGRSKSKFEPALTKFRDLNASAEIIFLEAQVSSLKEVDRVCTIIKTRESTIDILWLSQGGMSLAEHQLTPEGLKSTYAITFYSRVLFMHSLLPLLNKSPDPRIISILSAGNEGKLNLADPGLVDPKNDTAFWASLRQEVMSMSLAMRELSLENPRVSFIHTTPGLVSTAVHAKWAETMTGPFTVFRWLLKLVGIPLFALVGWTLEQAGQVGLYEMTNERLSASTGMNFFRVDGNAEDMGNNKLLSQYVEDRTGKKVWEHTLKEFDRILA